MKSKKENQSQKKVNKKPKQQNPSAKKESNGFEEKFSELNSRLDELDKIADNMDKKYDLRRKIKDNFMEYEKKYREEISELFKNYEEDFEPMANYIDGDEDDAIRLTPHQIPYYYVFLSKIIDDLGKEHPVKEGDYDIYDIRESATISVFDYFSLIRKSEKESKFYKKMGINSYERAITSYGWFDYRFKTMLEKVGITIEI